MMMPAREQNIPITKLAKNVSKEMEIKKKILKDIDSIDFKKLRERIKEEGEYFGITGFVEDFSKEHGYSKEEKASLLQVLSHSKPTRKSFAQHHRSPHYGKSHRSMGRQDIHDAPRVSVALTRVKWRS